MLRSQPVVARWRWMVLVRWCLWMAEHVRKSKSLTTGLTPPHVSSRQNVALPAC